jgi:DNA-binding response OmpR family regulator
MNRASILIVDDKPLARRALNATLTEFGYAVFESRTGEEALGRLKRNPVDLVLLDLDMPGSDGLEACRAIRKSSSLPIIGLSIHNTERDRVDALDAGADGYVTEPFGMQDSLRVFALQSGAHLRRITHAPVGMKTPNYRSISMSGA